MISKRGNAFAVSISLLLSWIASGYNQADVSHNLKGASFLRGALNSTSSLPSSSHVTSFSNLRHLTAKCCSRMLCREVFLHCLIHSSTLKVLKSSLLACNLIRAVAVAFSLPVWTNNWISFPHALSLALVLASHLAVLSTFTWCLPNLEGSRA